MTGRLALGLLHAITAVVFVNPAAAAPARVSLCLTSEGPIVDERLVRFQLAAWQKALSTELYFDCRAPNPVLIRLAKSPARPHPPDALGATRIANGKLQPDITVFCDSVRAMLPEPAPLIESRALARVIAHELVHLLLNRAQHVADGLNDELLTARRLREPAPATLLAGRE
jgi:hypothetical protein